VQGLSAVAERAHLAIGEVLGLLQEEFPDITISKIRFLESQGLLDPERTASGYRKFYNVDIDRLRWILRQQRDQFLPLRVIKARLEELGRLSGGDDPVAADGDHAGRHALPFDDPDDLAPAPEPAAAIPVPVLPVGSPASAVSVPAVTAAPPPTTPGEPLAPPAAPGAGGVLDAGPTEVSFTRAELAAAAALSERDLEQLEQYGLVQGRLIGREHVFGGESLVVARVAAAFGRFGVEARHLRMYKTFADREVAVYEQLVTALLRQRNPSSRDQAGARFGELAGLGRDLREALLRQALHDLLH